MLITRISQITGITRTIEMPVTIEQLDSWQHGSLIQDAMPGLSDSQREFIMTGITQDEWDEFVAGGDE